MSIIIGADIILDFVGAPYWEKHSKCVATDGRIVHLGFVSRYNDITVVGYIVTVFIHYIVVGWIGAELNQSPGRVEKESDTHLLHSKKQVTGLQGATGQRCRFSLTGLYIIDTSSNVIGFYIMHAPTISK